MSNKLNQKEKDYLLNLARQTLNYYFETGEELQIIESEIPERLKVKQGVFVTLEKDGELRGCIGYIEPVMELYQGVINNALSAGLHDNRFTPVTQEELNDIKIEISVLSVPEERTDISARSRPEKLKPLIDGVVLREGNRSSTFLPQVWEDLSDPIEFLSSLCQKGGWSADCWKEESVKLYTYQADVFSED